MIKKAVISIYFLLFGINILFSQNNKNISTFVVDTELSSVEWFCGRHHGCVSLDTGYVKVVDGEISNGKFVIDLNSLYDEDIDSELLRKTLANVIKSFEFFDVHKYPNTIFVLEKIKKMDNDEYYVTGQLTIKDKTLPVSFKSEIDFTKDSLFVYSDYISIDRTDWGINYLSKKFDPKNKEQMHVPDKIEFLVRLKAVRSEKKDIKK